MLTSLICHLSYFSKTERIVEWSFAWYFDLVSQTAFRKPVIFKASSYAQMFIFLIVYTFVFESLCGFRCSSAFCWGRVFEIRKAWLWQPLVLAVGIALEYNVTSFKRNVTLRYNVFSVLALPSCSYQKKYCTFNVLKLILMNELKLIIHVLQNCKWLSINYYFE